MHNLFIFVGPSGSGKTTLADAVLANDPHIVKAITTTTRSVRPGEVNGVDYHFMTIAEFTECRVNDELLEHAFVHGNYYGVHKKSLINQLAESDVALIVDWQGARHIKKLMPEAIEIFILPPSLEELEKRLSGRGSDERDTIVRRILAAGHEIQQAEAADFIVINGKFEQAVNSITDIIKVHRMRFAHQKMNNSDLFNQLGI
jgi:guanylate kinase